MKHAIMRPCAGCGAMVLHLRDIDTEEPIVLDAERVDEGTVAVYAAGPVAVARRHGRPARLQPAWREHDCPTPTITVPPLNVVVEDPYEDAPAAVQQHGGWRA